MKNNFLSFLLIFSLLLPPPVFANEEFKIDPAAIVPDTEAATETCEQQLMPTLAHPLGLQDILAKIGTAYWNLAMEGELFGKKLPYIYGFGTYANNMAVGWEKVEADRAKTKIATAEGWDKHLANAREAYEKRSEWVDTVWGTDTKGFGEFSWERLKILWDYTINVSYWIKRHYAQRMWKEALGFLTNRFSDIPKIVGKTIEERARIKDETLKRAQLSTNATMGRLIGIGGEARADFHHAISALGAAACGIGGCAGTILFIPLAPGVHIFIVAGQVFLGVVGVPLYGLYTLGATGVLMAWNSGGYAMDWTRGALSASKKRAKFVGRTAKFVVGSGLFGGLGSLFSAGPAFVGAVVATGAVFAKEAPIAVYRATRDNWVFPAEVFSVKTGIQIQGDTFPDVKEKMKAVVETTGKLQAALGQKFEIRRKDHKFGPEFGSRLDLTDRQTGLFVARLEVETHRAEVKVFCRAYIRTVEKLRTRTQFEGETPSKEDFMERFVDQLSSAMLASLQTALPEAITTQAGPPEEPNPPDALTP